MTVTLKQAQAKMPELIRKVAEGEALIVTEQEQVAARIVAERRPASQRPGPALCKDIITIVSDDQEHLNDLAEYMP